MADCECIQKCPFFNDRMKDTTATASIYKRRYCHGDAGLCARYLIFKNKGRQAVPADLYPNQNERAEAILSAV